MFFWYTRKKLRTLPRRMTLRKEYRFVSFSKTKQHVFEKADVFSKQTRAKVDFLERAIYIVPTMVKIFCCPEKCSAANEFNEHVS